MALAAHLSSVLALLMAGLTQSITGSHGTQDLGPWPLELKEVFKLFQIQYNRSYANPAEYARRLDIFAHNLAKAQQLQEEDLGTAEFGVTPFSDLTEEEFGQIYGHWKADVGPSMGRKVGFEEAGESVPPTCDWRKANGIISSVKNQGTCKCCWAMAAVGNVEALWGITFQQTVELSVQELIDCGRCGNGCEGGFTWDAYITVLNNSGLASEKDYPFQGHAKTHRCLAKKFQKVAWIQDFIMLPSDEQTIAGYLASQGPITVTINSKLLQHYRSGVIKATPTTCDPAVPDHAVLLVGFGRIKEEEGTQTASSPSCCHPHPRPRRSTPYWILKNSWGDTWGEKGYFLLHRGSNACGIAKYPLTARVKSTPKPPVSCPP